MIVGKTFEISYAHRLMNHPGKCRFLHGHTGKVEVLIDGLVDLKTGMVIDFGFVSDVVVADIQERLDHKTILQDKDSIYDGPEVVRLNLPPTAEILSSYIYERVYTSLYSLGDRFSYTIRFWETPSSFVECSMASRINVWEVVREYEVTR